MKRAIVCLALVLGGCGVAPVGETVAADCQATLLDPMIRVTSSASDPWGYFQGTIVAYANPDGTYLILGIDTSLKIRWWMQGGTTTDVAAFEKYPQSLRECEPPSGSPTSGTPPKAPPENNCYYPTPPVPPTYATDANTAWNWGPYLDTWDAFCSYGTGGCKVCSDYGYTCGNHVNNCGWTLHCGSACSCPCGGTYPRCLICSPF